MIIADLTEAERLHLGVALRDRSRALRRDGSALPPLLVELADACMRPGADRSGQDYGLAGPVADDGRAGLSLPVLLDGAEAARRLGCSGRQVRRLAAAGVLAPVLVNGRRKYRPADLEKFVAGLPPGKRAG